MSALTIINLVSNVVIFTSVLMFVISVFGNAKHPIWNSAYQAYVAKIGLCISGCGALLNILNLSTPNITEIILNIGLSLNFGWLSWWQYIQTKKEKQKEAKTKAPKVLQSKASSVKRKPRAKV